MTLAEPQYLQNYGLEKAPFRLTPDPGFFFPSAAHFAAKSVLSYAIAAGEGFMALIGRAGTGKTLLLRLLMMELPPEKIPALILCPALSPSGLMHLLLRELGEQAPETAETALLYSIFQHKLLRIAESNQELLIIVDEAQNLPVETLEQLRMLSNIELSEKKLLQILLVGQPKLEELLQDPRLGQLSERIAIYERLPPLTLAESIEYITFRLTKAGRSDLNLTAQAKQQLYARTNGVPRLINRLMDRALLFASAEKSATITASHIAQACQTLPHKSSQRFSLVPRFGKKTLIIATACLAFCLLAGLYWWQFSDHKTAPFAQLFTSLPATEMPQQKLSQLSSGNVPTAPAAPSDTVTPR